MSTNLPLPRRATATTISPQLPQRKPIDQTHNRDAWRAAISSSRLPRRPDPIPRKRELTDSSTEYLPLSKHRKLPARPERHHVQEMPSNHERSASVGSSSSVLSYSPILHDDNLANSYAQYLQWRMITIEADESTDRKRMEEENRLWAIYDSLWELRENYGSDNPVIVQIGDRLKQFSTMHEQLEDMLEGMGTMKSSDGLVQNLQSILDEIHTSARDLGGVALETEFRALENCRRIMSSVAQVEAENQSLSAML
ncbi:hypothetical protein BJV82DRAFT_617441 [Fennellomyces sp. T-0311]|nr:hypothetical protein BJV82DRAFT_617441 [Fennellomyces sp. T-0311]